MNYILLTYYFISIYYFFEKLEGFLIVQFLLLYIRTKIMFIELINYIKKTNTNIYVIITFKHFMYFNYALNSFT